ncbi:granzyme-like protein 1 isoform X1 [Alosa sapidissima]|uniref:granzyme-like protein 1 isoform X1 n=2 Tax=Alosa sapidissima TaxID=34773 RepID=UPI001C08666D|nr:granzyme-like protein 1 isoform X1 [Alosa sapidissima]
MMQLLQLLNIVLVMLSVFNQGDCMRDNIIGGHVAKPHSHPYMVLIPYESQGNIWRECDGFLVREDFVMTAAHCKGMRMFVFPGVHDKSKLDKNLRVEATPFVHPNYTLNENEVKNDIMLLKLKQNVTLTNKVGLLALPEKKNAIPTTDCLVSGWGSTVFNHPKNSDLLREVNVTVNTSLNCDTPATICTRGSIGPFQGDSGGPLVCGEVACGVVSACKFDGETYTHYYTRIAHFRHWIDKMMNTIH